MMLIMCIEEEQNLNQDQRLIEMKINDKLQEADETEKEKERERKGQQLQGQMNLWGQKKNKIM